MYGAINTSRRMFAAVFYGVAYTCLPPFLKDGKVYSFFQKLLPPPLPHDFILSVWLF
jgi:hypothetical protein